MSLKGREHTIFSELTPVEKTILLESDRELTNFNTVLKTRSVREASAGMERDGKKKKANP